MDSTELRSYLDGAAQHAHDPEHAQEGALILFGHFDRAGACGENPLLHHCQHDVLPLQLLHQHMLHVHVPGTRTI